MPHSNRLAELWFVFSSRRRHTRLQRDWSSDVCSSDLYSGDAVPPLPRVVVVFKGNDCVLRSEEHASELQSPCNLVCRLLLEQNTQKQKAVHNYAPIDLPECDQLAQVH